MNNRGRVPWMECWGERVIRAHIIDFMAWVISLFMQFALAMVFDKIGKDKLQMGTPLRSTHTHTLFDLRTCAGVYPTETHSNSNHNWIIRNLHLITILIDACSLACHNTRAYICASSHHYRHYELLAGWLTALANFPNSTSATHYIWYDYHYHHYYYYSTQIDRREYSKTLFARIALIAKCQMETLFTEKHPSEKVFNQLNHRSVFHIQYIYPRLYPGYTSARGIDYMDINGDYIHILKHSIH